MMQLSRLLVCLFVFTSVAPVWATPADSTRVTAPLLRASLGALRVEHRAYQRADRLASDLVFFDEFGVQGRSVQRDETVTPSAEGSLVGSDREHFGPPMVATVHAIPSIEEGEDHAFREDLLRQIAALQARISEIERGRRKPGREQSGRKGN